MIEIPMTYLEIKEEHAYKIRMFGLHRRLKMLWGYVKWNDEQGLKGDYWDDFVRQEWLKNLKEIIE